MSVSGIPQVLGGKYVGQMLILISRSDTDSVILSDGNGLSLNGAWLGGAESVLELIWDGANWTETGRR